MSFALLLACGGCKKKGVLAELLGLQGEVLRDRAEAPTQWQDAEVGHTFVMGDGIKTSAGAHARLRLSDGSRLDLKPEALLRFLAAAEAERSFDVEMGEVQLELGAAPMRLRSAVGLAVIEPGTRLTISQEGRKTRYEVLVGTARFQQADLPALEVQGGQRITVDLDTAQIEREHAPPPREVVEVPAEPEPVPEVANEAIVAARVSGRGVRYRDGDRGTWQPLPPGPHELAKGGRLGLPQGASVHLSGARGEAATLHGAGEFRLATEGSLVETEHGRVHFEGPSADTAILVPGGTIVIRLTPEGTVADVLVARKRPTQVTVVRGVVMATSRFGSDELTAGEELTLVADGSMKVRGRGPEVPDLTVAAGESFVVHDPTPPTAVEVDFSARCPEGGRLRFGAKRIVLPRRGGKASAITLLSPGGHRYAVLCDGGASVAEGSIQVVRDAGTARLPRVPPASIVDTDGRNYTIMYQNLLPEVQVRWPAAPKGSAYRLSWQAGATTKDVTLTKPKFVFKPSALGEGNYEMTFVALKDGVEAERSKTTAVKIRFDNAAPAAVVRTPPNRRFKTGETVEVVGIALPGWAVSSMGEELTLDPQHRFFGQVRATPDRGSIAIRFAHQERGVHYYLRRPAGKAP